MNQRLRLFFLSALFVSSVAMTDKSNAQINTEFNSGSEFFYFETTNEIKIANFLRDTAIILPRNSILFIHLSDYLNVKDSNRICNIRIVDIGSEELRESSELPEDDSHWCMKYDSVSSLNILHSSKKEMKLAFEEKDFSFLEKLALAEEASQADQLERVGSQKYRNPIISPLRSSLLVTSVFGQRIHPIYGTKRMHRGVDFAAKQGESVFSVYPGKVLATRNEVDKSGRLKGYGRYMIVVHPDQNMETIYAHLSAFRVRAGTTIKQGQAIALAGNTGTSSGPHLHFETRLFNNPRTPGIGFAINPLIFLKNIFKPYL